MYGRTDVLTDGRIDPNYKKKNFAFNNLEKVLIIRLFNQGGDIGLLIYNSPPKSYNHSFLFVGSKALGSYIIL